MIRATSLLAALLVLLCAAAVAQAQSLDEVTRGLEELDGSDGARSVIHFD